MASLLPTLLGAGAATISYGYLARAAISAGIVPGVARQGRPRRPRCATPGKGRRFDVAQQREVAAIAKIVDH
jgi:hypothetical protein